MENQHRVPAYRRRSGLRGSTAATAALLAAGILNTSLAWSAQIPIASVPLFLGQSVRPNVFFEVDDSGSMDFEIMTRRYWHACAYNSSATGRGGNDDCEALQIDGLFNGYDGGGYDTYYYMFDNDDSVYNRPEVVPDMPGITDEDWRILSSDFNTLYFEPDASYEPWPGESDQSFTSARSDPRSGKDGYNDTTDLTGFTFAIWDDTRGYTGGRPHRGTDVAPEWFGVNTDTADSGTNSAFVNGSGEAVLGSASIGANGSSGTLDVWLRRGDGAFSENPDGSENLIVEYLSQGGDWVRLESFVGGGTPGQIYDRTYTLPPDALHTDLRVRFRMREGSGATFDFWHIDDVEVTVDGSSVFSDDFESGSLAASRWGDLSVNATSSPNGEVDLWDDHRLVTVNGSGITVVEVSYNPTTAGLNRSATTVTGATAMSEFGMTLAELKQNIANWYSFGRRRSLVLKASVGAVLEDNPSYRYGLSVLNNDDDLFVEVPTATAGDFSSHNNDLYDALKDFDFPNAGTPLKEGLERTGEYFANNDGRNDPIDLECQKNFTLLMSDGHWSAGSDGVGSDEDGDGFSDTLADTAHYYYENDLSTLADNVPPDPADPAEYQHMVTFPVAFGVDGVLRDLDGDGWPDPDLGDSDNWGDPTSCSFQQCPEKIDDMWHAARNSHGTFVSAKTPQALTDALQGALGTIAERESSAAAVAVNSGSYQSGSKLFQARFNSLQWTGDLIAYPLEVIQSPVVANLQFVRPSDTPEWQAQDVIAGRDPDDREIITYKASTDAGIPFDWPTDPTNPSAAELDPAQIAALNEHPDSGTPDARGEQRLEYLRGERSQEGTASGDFRERESILGDLVNSAPVFVGDPRFLYPEEWPAPQGMASAPETSYSAFFQAQEGRTPMVYVGGNDGMLHAFNANDVADGAGNSLGGGDEEFAFVPGAAFEDLNELTGQDYTHQYYVDGPPAYADAFFNGSWHSVLVGGLRAGGQGVYALDVTNPSQFSEGNADDIVLWEFTDRDNDGDGETEGDPDLGLTFSQPSVVRLQNGDWAAVFGNGYNNTASDGSASSTGNAVLYIVDIETGNLIRKIDTGVGAADDPEGNNRPNGLSTPAVTDVDGDAVADYAYAGDLFGNLWKFDLTGDTPSSWESAVTSGNDPAPMFTAVSPDSGNPRQPITARPEVGRHPAGKDGFMVYFGTGKYLGQADDTQVDQDTQSFYAVWDFMDTNGNQEVFDRSMLLDQEITAEVDVTRDSVFEGTSDSVNNTLRITSDHDIGTWFDNQGNSNGEHAGWVMDLIDPDDGDNHGERAVTNPQLRNDRIIFTTLIPNNSPCGFGGDSWLMELSARDGGRLSEPPFDLNEDSDYGVADRSDTGVIPGGIKSKKGIYSEAAILSVPGGEVKLLSSSSGEVDAIQENSGDEDRGRQAWEELR